NWRATPLGVHLIPRASHFEGLPALLCSLGPPGPWRDRDVASFPQSTPFLHAPGCDPEWLRLLPADWLLLRPGDVLRAEVPAVTDTGAWSLWQLQRP
ncbi:mCG141421, partial [Mus musculus]